MICENCGEHYTVDKWWGCCCGDCYTGRMNARSTARFLELVKLTEATIKNKINENKLKSNNTPAEMV